MKRYRVVAFLALLSMAACGNPTAPRFPQDEDDPTGGDPPPSTGFVLSQGDVRLV